MKVVTKLIHVIMEPEEPYIPYEERTPKQLCRDILLQAEKLYVKKDRRGLLIAAVFVLAFVVVGWYMAPEKEKMWVYAWVVAELAVYFVFFLINKKLINEMNLTATPRQFLSMVQRLCKTLKLRNFILLVLGLWPSLCFIPFLSDLVKVRLWWIVLSIIPTVLIAWLFVSMKPDRLIDSDFYSDVEDLEYQLNK